MKAKKKQWKNWKNGFCQNRMTKLYASIKISKEIHRVLKDRKILDIKSKRTWWLADKFNNSAGKLIACFPGENAPLKHELKILHPVVTYWEH